MTDFVRLSVPITADDATAARRVREWFSSPAVADLCAGVEKVDVGTLERLHAAVGALNTRLVVLMRIATGATTRDFSYSFAVTAPSGDATGSVTVTMPTMDCFHAARLVATNALIERAAEFPAGAYLSRAEPRVTLIPL